VRGFQQSGALALLAHLGKLAADRRNIALPLGSQLRKLHARFDGRSRVTGVVASPKSSFSMMW
jgi:hypothetical protein